MSDAVLMDEFEYRHTGPRNAFRFDPEPLHEHALSLADCAEKLGYRLLTLDMGYTLTEIQRQLREEGPAAFLRRVQVQEDISPVAPEPSTAEFVLQRLLRLAPASELIITDPYMFTSTRTKDASVYAALVERIIAPILAEGASLHFVTDARVSAPVVQAEVTAALKAVVPDLKIRTSHSGDFHDRFWIADRTRGVILGTSLNKIGNKIFFIDSLASSDVTAVLTELEQLQIKQADANGAAR